MVGVEALDLREPVNDLAPADAEPLRQLVAQMRLVYVAGGFRVVVDRRVVEPGPASLGEGGVCDQDMGMQLHVAGAGGAVDVAGGKEPVAVDELATTGTAPSPARLPLQVAETGFHGGGVCGFDLGGDGVPAERPQDRDRLRRGEGEIEAGDRAALDVAKSKRLAARRVRPGQHPRQLVGINLPLQAEIVGGIP